MNFGSSPGKPRITGNLRTTGTINVRGNGTVEVTMTETFGPDGSSRHVQLKHHQPYSEQYQSYHIVETDMVVETDADGVITVTINETDNLYALDTTTLLDKPKKLPTRTYRITPVPVMVVGMRPRTSDLNGMFPTDADLVEAVFAHGDEQLHRMYSSMSTGSSHGQNVGATQPWYLRPAGRRPTGL